jgi:hypothetical protein
MEIEIIEGFDDFEDAVADICSPKHRVEKSIKHSLIKR